MVTHNLNVLEKHSVFSGNTFPRNFSTNRVKRRSIKSEDPMSHRIIEKRRRDRMNNCLADLSRLIPPEYLKKGRGRIEKTEIIEMAVKHIGHLQNVISSARFNENSNGSIPFTSLSSSILTNETPSASLNHPFTLNHYKKGYLECMSEALHFLVEVQGYFAEDTLCVQMINHLRQHCDKILNGNTLNFLKSQTSGDLTSSESSGSSPINIICGGSPHLITSHSAGSPSDDNIPIPGYQTDECYSPESYLDFYWNLKKHSNNGYHENVESDSQENGGENRFAFESRSDSVVRYQVQEGRKKEPKIYCESGKACHKNYHVMSNAFEPVNYDNLSVKDENGSSDSRETPTSEVVDPFLKTRFIVSNVSGCNTPTKEDKNVTTFRLKTADPPKENPCDSSVQHSESNNSNHVIMYKFKNNIKQRFSRERKEIERDECPAKKSKPEECQQWEDSNGRERVSLVNPTANGEEVYKSNHADAEGRRLKTFPPKLKFQTNDLSIRLNFGHNANERGSSKRWGSEFGPQCHYPQNPWNLSPTNNYEYPEGCKSLSERISLQEYPSISNNSFGNVSILAETVNSGIPIFALHAKRSFYVPLTLDPATLAPFLPLLGLAQKPDSDVVDEKPVFHPVTISVNFQSHLIR